MLKRIWNKWLFSDWFKLDLGWDVDQFKKDIGYLFSIYKGGGFYLMIELFDDWTKV